ncbi:MAG TPA: hypothetical protein DCL35_01755 [Candidatus Omnitrophica bacterium]|nr:hypothetical protein [Candidatus Omnitrophota bacterium]
MIAGKKFLNPEEPEPSLVSRLLYQLIDEKYRALLDESSDFMSITARDGKFIYVNKKLADSLGYTKKELLGMHMDDIVAEESRHVFSEKAKELFKGGKVVVEGFVLKTKFKGKIVGELSAIAFYDNTGKYCGAKAVFKDRTKMLAIEKLEKKYETMLEDGIGSLDTIIIILDKDYRIKWASPSVQKYFGLDKSAIAGEDIRKLLKERLSTIICKDEMFFNRLLSIYEANECVAGQECEITSEDNEKYFLEQWSYPISHGELAGGRIDIYRDITARKKSEEQLEYYYKKIHAIMEHAVEGIAELKVDNSIEFVNMSFLNMLGYSESEMLNRTLSDFISSDETSHLVSIKLIRKAREITFIKKDGTILYALVSSIPLVFGAQPPHALCFISDITETKMAANKLRDANLTLRALNDSLLDLSMRDVHTGVYNYRYLTERLSEEIKRAKRYFRPFSVIMSDIDFFKAVNDTYGHSFGDIVLKEFASLLKQSVRETDIVVRSGGEEFIVFLADTDPSGAAIVANKIIKAVQAAHLGDADRRVQITISIGIASYPDVGITDSMALLAAVDEAMYQSKGKGRNQISVYSKISLDEKSRKQAVTEGVSYEHLKERLKAIYERNEEAILESMMPMVREADKRWGYRHGHIDKLVGHVDNIAASFSMSDKDRKNARRAALLSNLGLLTVPAKILLKKGPLTAQEYKLVKEHPLRSLEIIRDFPFLLPLGRDILHHHERFDSQGYPEGLNGGHTPLVAKMIAVAEAFEAMVNPRPYRLKVFSKEEALDLIRKESGKQLDPAVVGHFLKIAQG